MINGCILVFIIRYDIASLPHFPSTNVLENYLRALFSSFQPAEAGKLYLEVDGRA